MTGLAHGDLGAIDELASAVSEFAETTCASARSATDVAEKTCSQIDAEVSGRRARVEGARAALAACLADERANCAGLEMELARAVDRLERSQEAQRIAQRAKESYLPRAQRYLREAARLLGEGRSLFMHQSGDLQDYLSGSNGGQAMGAGESSTGRQASGAQTSGLPDGWSLVPLTAIDTTDSAVHGEQSFRKGYSPADLAWAFTALEEVVLPALAAGQGQDYFQARDQAEGRVGTRSYTDTYLGFFRDSAIKLEPRGDGTYGVGNGYHRIWVARRLGLSAVPARVR